MMLEEKISPAIQRDAIEALAARRGFHIPPGIWPNGGWIEDLDVSGRSFQRTIMEAIGQGGVGRGQGDPGLLGVRDGQLVRSLLPPVLGAVSGGALAFLVAVIPENAQRFRTADWLEVNNEGLWLGH
jgi:hypothetical protein